MTVPTIQNIYRLLRGTYGEQYWWPGESRFEVLVGAILVQNTAWTNAEAALQNLRQNHVLTPEKIVSMSMARLGKWIRPSGYYNVKSRRLQALCRWVVDNRGIQALEQKKTSALRDSLLSVYGVGPETADAILLYGFERPTFVIDAYTRRLFQRIGIIRGDESYDSLRALFSSTMPRDIKAKVRAGNEYHALIVRHGKESCRKIPRCRGCVLNTLCQSKNE